jgi:hypothetical protein
MRSSLPIIHPLRFRLFTALKAPSDCLTSEATVSPLQTIPAAHAGLVVLSRMATASCWLMMPDLLGSRINSGETPPPLP